MNPDCTINNKFKIWDRVKFKSGKKGRIIVVYHPLYIPSDAFKHTVSETLETVDKKYITWNKNYPGWTEKSVYGVWLDSPSYQMSFEEFVEYFEANHKEKLETSDKLFDKTSYLQGVYACTIQEQSALSIPEDDLELVIDEQEVEEDE